MPLDEELKRLDGLTQRLIEGGTKILGGSNSSIFVLDFIVIGAIKRSLSLVSGISAMIRAKNMVCARALLRMHLDTVTRLLGYTYVEDPERIAREVTGGAQLRKFKSREGDALTDAYLVARLSKEHPWVQRVYNFTSGYVHFSEQQFFDSVRSVSGDDERTLRLQIGHVDDKFPEFSWAEIAACFSELTGMLLSVLSSYETHKATNPSFKGT